MESWKDSSLKSPKTDNNTFSEKEAMDRFEATLRGALKTPPKAKGQKPMPKDSGGGKRTENPPPRTSTKVEREAGQKLSSGNKTERSLSGSVMRHIEPRKPPKR
jgi:hypothetical protein